MPLTLDAALTVSAVLFACTTLYMSIEYVALLDSGMFSPRGILDWEVLSLIRRWTARGRRAGLLARLFEPAAFRKTILLQTLLAICILCGLAFGSDLLVGLSSAGLFGIGLLLAVRHPFGRDGADEMLNLLAFGLSVAFLAPTATLRTMAALFICGQLVLSYLVAGIAKLRSRAWMKEGVLAGILGTEVYGRGQKFGSWLRNHRTLDLVAGITVVLLESAVPLIFFVPDSLAYVWLSALLSFHVAAAFLMGLNTFLLAYSGALAVLYWLVGV